MDYPSFRRLERGMSVAVRSGFIERLRQDCAIQSRFLTLVHLSAPLLLPPLSLHSPTCQAPSTAANTTAPTAQLTSTTVGQGRVYKPRPNLTAIIVSKLSICAPSKQQEQQHDKGASPDQCMHTHPHHRPKQHQQHQHHCVTCAGIAGMCLLAAVRRQSALRCVSTLTLLNFSEDGWMFSRQADTVALEGRLLGGACHS
jgi:hypothetical protein